MKYNRKAVIAAIVKIQKEKFETEKKELEAKIPGLEIKAKEAAANFILNLTPEAIRDSFEAPRFDIGVTPNRKDKTSLVYFKLNLEKVKKSELLDKLAKAYEDYSKLKERLRNVDYYLSGYYRNGYTNLTEKVKAEVPYDYELQADELLKNPEFVTDIEALRKQIFKD